MTTLNDKIRAVVDEAERRLETATTVPWSFTPCVDPEDSDEELIRSSGGGCVAAVGPGGDARTISDADLIVSVVNRERAQIEHAYDVLERHRPMREIWPNEKTWSYANGEWCHGCGTDGEDAYPRSLSMDECPEILSLARAWGVEP